MTNNEVLHGALLHAVAKVEHLMEKFPEDFPSASTNDLLYQHKPNKEWTAGFFSGMVWLAYEVTNDQRYKQFAQKQTKSFRMRLDNCIATNFHDLGFLYSLSCVADYKLTGSEFAKETAVLAAGLLAARFQKKGQFIQAWSDLDDPEEYRLIIDCFLNLPLLFWATTVTGDSSYAEIAQAHFKTAVATVIRPDFSTYHTYFFDRETGKPLRGATNQGYADESYWSRGQAWAIYGIQLFLQYCPLGFQEENQRFLKVLSSFQEMLSEDSIPVWDFKAKEDSQLKDSSAAAIVICGLQTYLSSPNKEANQKASITELKNKMLQELMIHYDSIHQESKAKVDGLLLHGTHHWPRKQGVDEAVLWGDYFYFEALVREAQDWQSYW
ncbi:glycoside hydrolase family 88 protein [Enterococcus sp. DIV0086]|uniref:glycoside hydrolase family 88 protein n=1 Tax=Enterococcus sp. DIV0086 TaxID=2774655 RepID=UPI003D2CE208